MTTFSLNPTYYSVTWTQNGETDYSSLTGINAGGLDSTSASNYNRIIYITGTLNLSGNPMSAGDAIIINGYKIAFDTSDTKSSILGKINLATKFTGVIADTRVSANYITLANAPGHEGAAFYISDAVSGSLSHLGLTAGQYSLYPSMVGSAYSTVNGGNVTINGVNIVFTSGNLGSIVTQINSHTQATGVTAYSAATSLQIASNSGQPFAINGGNVVSNLGISTGNFGGYPSTLENSQNKERANMRWQQVINELESFSTPNFVGNVVITGNKTGETAPDTFSFVIGYEHPAQVSTIARPSEPDAGTVLEGTDAIKRSVARGLTSDIIGNRKVFDPTLLSYGPYTDRPNALRIENITAGKIDSVANIVTGIEPNITVAQISGV
jgi:hypothetical protein